MIVRARPSTVAAPPMSFFIRPIDAAGLMSSPPVSKHTPLPTSVSAGPVTPQVISISRGGRVEARPTAWIIGKFDSRSASPVVTVTSPPKSAAKARTAASSSAGPMSEDGVLIRSRVSASPAAIASIRAASMLAGAISCAAGGGALR